MTRTLGTSATTSLTAQLFAATMADADVGALDQGIFDDQFASNTLQSFTATLTSGSPVLASVSSFVGISIGTQLAGTGIPFDSAVIAINTGASTLTLENNVTANGSQSLKAFAPGGGPGGQFSKQGLLFVPRRGVLKVLPGDYVGVDPYGWPILVSAFSIANGPWSHS